MTIDQVLDELTNVFPKLGRGEIVTDEPLKLSDYVRSEVFSLWDENGSLEANCKRLRFALGLSGLELELVRKRLEQMEKGEV